MFFDISVWLNDKQPTQGNRVLFTLKWTITAPYYEQPIAQAAQTLNTINT